MLSEFNACDICHKADKTVSLQISRSQLIFGGFRGKMCEYRCATCEKELAKSIGKMLKKVSGE